MAYLALGVFIIIVVIAGLVIRTSPDKWTVYVEEEIDSDDNIL